jgi:hypothetical protein
MIIATRTLYVRDAGGETPVTVSMTGPMPRPEFEDYSCSFRIVWPGHVSEMDISGADAFQALALTLKSIGTMLYTSSYHRDGVPFADYCASGYGFPVHSNVRDMLVGEDAVYQ